jgi:protein tyrosine/serine phosphatase
MMDRRTGMSERRAGVSFLLIAGRMLILAFVVACVGCPHTVVAPVRSETWAVPIDRRGVPNLHRVNGDLYRGAQPTAEGMAELKRMGIRTIINLRSFHSDRDDIGETGLAYEHVYMKAWHPEDEDVVRFLQIVTDENRTPVFVHCKRGADRTGAMCAVYRVVVEGWTRDEAIREMIGGSFDFHGAWDNLADYLNELDLDDIRRRVKG